MDFYLYYTVPITRSQPQVDNSYTLKHPQMGTFHTYMLQNVCDYIQVSFPWIHKHAFNKILMEDFMKISTKWLFYKTGEMTGYQCL